MTKPPENIKELAIREIYEKDVLAIWKKFENHEIFSNPDFEYRKHPLLPEIVHKESLMFIGMNPSFRKGSVIPENEKNIGFYQIPKEENFKDIPYFEKMKEIAEYCSTKWTHLDLFFIRETKQELIESLSYTDFEFLNLQLEISFEIIERAKPKLIIVSNALASEFFGKMKTKHKSFKKIWKGFDLFFEDNNILGKKSTFNSEIGTYEIELNNEKVPIIFSGMLSGQRALDIGSLERLKWQSKMILESRTKK
ncbi:hypothetical protein ES677_14890 [Bizionia gelidisalsuginis]|uniref:Uracil-DNA glycosylase-like domain-containing protein n=1 Tax=Bizionia gelidisalsuginis TaxID=291188 RepID=A0ABY3M6W0_9FLAO|nr:hypothetical protein [Bizionia gelidisalsuginis]TYC07796.1 hypothetical protein ES677_14890 [Bizionia gelidisalsuginis]